MNNKKEKLWKASLRAYANILLIILYHMFLRNIHVISARGTQNGKR